MDKEKMTTGGRKYSYRVYKAVAAYMFVQLDEYAMDAIDALDKAEVLDAFLEWEGIIGYTSAILSIVNA